MRIKGIVVKGRDDRVMVVVSLCDIKEGRIICLFAYKRN